MQSHALIKYIKVLNNNFQKTGFAICSYKVSLLYYFSLNVMQVKYCALS